MILNLSRELGVNLAGIEIVLNMRDKMSQMQRQMEQFMQFIRHELAPALRSTDPRAPHEAIVYVGSPARDSRAQAAALFLRAPGGCASSLELLFDELQNCRERMVDGRGHPKLASAADNHPIERVNFGVFMARHVL